MLVKVSAKKNELSHSSLVQKSAKAFVSALDHASGDLRRLVIKLPFGCLRVRNANGVSRRTNTYSNPIKTI